jgi:hypothetical protein
MLASNPQSLGAVALDEVIDYAAQRQGDNVIVIESPLFDFVPRVIRNKTMKET